MLDLSTAHRIVDTEITKVLACVSQSITSLGARPLLLCWQWLQNSAEFLIVRSLQDLCPRHSVGLDAQHLGLRHKHVLFLLGLGTQMF